MLCISSLVKIVLLASTVSAFTPTTSSGTSTPTRPGVIRLHSSQAGLEEEQEDSNKRDDLKKALFQLGSGYDRGFGASPSARSKADQIMQELESVNSATNAAQGISGDDTSPLSGSWQMIWTTAQDVLVLAASPVATVGAIYQVFDPPIVTNIIDLIPRAQALFPPALSRSTLIRAEVTTRASPRPNQPMRIGLDFESVKIRPVELFGFEVDNLPPLGFDLPKIPGADPETSPGYFDVVYLDDELLIIRQNAPGGMFALAKVSDNDP